MNEIKRLSEFMNPLEIIMNIDDPQKITSAYHELSQEEQKEFLDEAKWQVENVNNIWMRFLKSVCIK